MRLYALRLQNFRQHVDTRLSFSTGLTGIIGPNGAGKSTLLEAIAWALYGNPAARGTRDSIRSTRAATPKAPVRVELEFELAGHRYLVQRTLTSAECYLDGGDTPIASTLTGVTELLQRRLGMTRTEFFHTYFTGQKELDVMAAMAPADRARFLSRVLGYDRLTTAQEAARERRKLLAAEAHGLRQGLGDADLLTRALHDATERVAVAAARADAASAALTTATAAVEAGRPRWREAQARRDAARALETEWQGATRDADMLARDVDRAARELEAARAAATTRAPLQAQLAALPEARAQLAALDALASAEGARARLVERQQQTATQRAALEARRTQLAPAHALLPEQQAAVLRLRAAAVDADHALDAQRTAWARDKQEVETRLQTLRAQYTELTEQRERLESVGADSPCPTCGRPLGARHAEVLESVREQLETLRLDGNYFRQRAEQLAEEPDPVRAASEARRLAQQELAQGERRLQKVQAAVEESQRLDADLARLDAVARDADAELAALPAGYDAGRHAEARRAVAALQEVATQVARLDVVAQRHDALRAEWEDAAARLASAVARRESLAAQRAPLAGQEDIAARAQAEEDAALRALRDAELERVTALADAAAARQHEHAAREAVDERARRQALLDGVDAERRLHDELDRALGEFRTDLTLQLRPELAELAGGFLDELTDGRYAEVTFDDDYRMSILDDGVAKPVISGGEEDLCNLVLRLAISQMIAERAGQAFSLLVLDEVFGSLDEGRRASVVELLRRLHDRFEQVIVITHIDQVREGLDRLVQVRYDDALGRSVVVDADAIAGEG
ncbi:MAG: SMC family ATPase [Gemmatimonadetes bacterium]|nr:SMC family ATPase [Gemmatimonadota bacterium]